MRITRRSSLAALTVTAALSAGIAVPSSAAPRQEGLVNVAVVDNTIQIPIGIAANVCDVSVNVLAEQLDQADNCDAITGATATRAGGDGGDTRQEGLVNLAVEDNVVQVPVGLAANICDVSANVLARQLDDAAPCDATGNGEASA